MVGRLYPLILHMTARVMRDRAPPSSYVFEALLAFDLFQVILPLPPSLHPPPSLSPPLTLSNMGDA